MPLLRLLLAGLVALAAMAAVFFTAVVVLFTGLMGWVMQLFRGRPLAGRAGPTSRRSTKMRMDDVIDVETTKVADDERGRKD